MTAMDARAGRSWEGVDVAAERYERNLVPALFEPWADVLVDLADVRPGEQVLDLACGTGVVARAAVQRVVPGGRVTGLDVNDDMLALARRTADGTGASDVIEWRRASAVDTGLPDACFDVAFCQQGLQFFPDRAAALGEMRRVLVPGGRAVIAAWCAADDGDAGYRAIAAASRRHVPDNPGLASFIEAIFALSDDADLERLVTDAGFDDVIVQRRTGVVRFPSAEAWVEAFIGAAPGSAAASFGPTMRAAIVADAAAGLQPYVDGTGLAFPIHTHIVLARAGRTGDVERAGPR